MSTLYGHKTPNPIGYTYAGVVSRDSVQILFTYADLKGNNVFAANIRNRYLQDTSFKKDYITCGPEFGLENVGKFALIYCSLYGRKSSGCDSRNNIGSCMIHL